MLFLTEIVEICIWWFWGEQKRIMDGLHKVPTIVCCSQTTFHGKLQQRNIKYEVHNSM